MEQPEKERHWLRLAASLGPGYRCLSLCLHWNHVAQQGVVGNQAASSATDPGLIKKCSNTRSYTVPSTGFTYPAIRTFYRAHIQDSKLPQEPCPLPLLVFIHGLGGSIAHFNPVLLSLTNHASCLAVDLPGCGASSFEPKAWEAYTTEALVHLLAVVIEAHRAVNENQTVILVGHSMGCSLAALLASTTSPLAHLMSPHVGGLIAICPKAEPPTAKETKQLHAITLMPATIFDLLRRWDRRGGIDSKSVLPMAGSDAEEGTKVLQLRYNQQSRSPVWQRMARGMSPDYSTGQLQEGLPGKIVWSGLEIPVFLLAGEDDNVTPVTHIKRIVNFLGRDVSAIQPPSEKVSLPIAAAPFDPKAEGLWSTALRHHNVVVGPVSCITLRSITVLGICVVLIPCIHDTHGASDCTGRFKHRRCGFDAR